MRKLSFSLVVLVLFFAASCATPGHPIRTGESIQALGPFSGGLAAVKIGDLWGFITPEGRVVIEPQFSETRGFHSGYAAVRLKERWGLIKGSGKYLILPKFADMGDFSEKLVPVKNEKGWGFADVSGKLILPAAFDEARSFHNGIAAVREGSRWGYIDGKNHFVVNPMYATTGDFLGKYAPVGTSVVDNGWGFVDATGAEVIKAQFDRAGAFSEGLAPVLVDDYWGFVSEAGILVVNPIFDEALGFANGLAAVKYHGKWGFIGHDGAMVIQPAYEAASAFDASELALVQVEGRRFFIAKDGKIPAQLALFKTAGTTTGPMEIERVSQTVAVDSSNLAASKSGISVSFPSDLVPAGVSKEASLVVYDRQFAEYSSNKYLSAGAQGIKLNINTTSILPEKRIRITVPYSGSFDPDSTYFIVEDQGIYPFVLDASLSNGILTGDLDSTWLVFLASRGISDANLNIVVMTKKPGAENDTAYTSSVQFWDDKNKTFTSLPSNLDLSGKKVCMVVHGLASKLADMVNLAGALAPAKNGEGKIAYDIVLGYEYGMLASIPTQGKDMAEKYLALKGARTTTRLDIFAHSMGNLVSRWAMQRPDKAGQTDFANSRIGQYVRNYVSLGGPHEGVPFKGAQWVLEGIKLALAQVGWPWFDCLNDLMCQGTPPKSSPEVLPWEPSSTVGMLNYNSNPNGKGPDFDSKDFKITTISGNVWDSYGVMGAAFATGYWFVFTNKQLDKLLEDGIVATYSAQGNELRKISSSVENIPTWKMNHGQMYNETTALKDIQGLVKRPGW